MSAFTKICRLYDPYSQADVLLDGCSAQVLIADVHATVTISQRFTSPEYWKNAASAVYTFGIMADAAVSGFEMVRQDGTKIEGIVKEKQEAKRKYDKAISAGKTASLGQQETADVFSIAVGNILPSETVTINFWVFKYITATAPSHFASVSLADITGFLTQDVVLVINAEGLDTPRCFIESHPSADHESTAIALTFVPRFSLPDVPGGMEYVFLVDRSGSMQGRSMQLVQEALVVLLRGLPSVGTTFNIVSFGNYATKLWQNSLEYSQRMLEDATNHVDSMTANYGGTEIGSALRMVYDSLPKPLARPVSIFLLTDWQCMGHLLEPGNPNSFIRVFTVGIGDGASSDTCESGFAVYVKQGEPVMGKCARLIRTARTPKVKVEINWGVKEPIDVEEDDFIVVEDSHTQAQAPAEGATATATTINPFDNKNIVDIDTVPATSNMWDGPRLHAFGPPPKPDPTLPPPPRIQQSPLDLPSMFPGTRTRIMVKGRVTNTGGLVELVVPVSTVLQDPSPLEFNSSSNAFLHTLAAKALIKDREEGKHAFPPTVSVSFETTTDKGAIATTAVTSTNKSQLKAAYLEKDIIRLGTKYGLASKYTSFVAVDPRKHDLIPVAPGLDSAALFGPPKPGSHGTLFGAPATSPVSSRFSSGFSFSRPHNATTNIVSGSALFGAAPAPAEAPSVSLWSSGGSVDAAGGNNTLFGSAAPTPAGSSFTSSGAVFSGSGSINSIFVKSESINVNTSSPGSTTTSSSSIPTGGALLAAIARLQQWHGGFQLTPSLLKLIGDAMGLQVHTVGFEEKLSKEGVDRDVGATLVALVWMESYGGEEALDMREKAETWVNGEVGEERAGVLKKGILGMLGAV
ncbi:hypothetical protein BT96DRAFT_923425 [Gymnopus androsaceus JB14]|uniref:VIT-domain-containing protein n=1 Tax=Gymnopus androsaceus JB14 TaxID=1447944 RepID=A0A6A4HBA3_9AGAR|nr:hypothetical protein BT96DRAFT_923425 [Gymnopus androsaceus JB14]